MTATSETPGASDPDGVVVPLLSGRYEVGPLVGVGATARVHRAWDRERGRAVAVKIFLAGATPLPGRGGSREIEVLAGIRSPGLVAVQGAGVDARGCPFVVMDLVEGGSLAARLHDGPLPATDVVGLGVVLADALAVVHARGVVHRDVKPANVLLDADGQPWLTDFGIARIVDATRVTATGLVVGTAAYMAPEQVRGELVGPPADVYALGLVLLEAVTGRREYEGAAVESALARLHRAPRVPADLPDPLAATLRAMTAPEPGARPAAAEVARALRAGGRRGGPDRSRRAGRRAVPVVALTSLVAAVVAGGMTLAGGHATSASGAGSARAPATASAPAAPPSRLPLAVPDLTNAVDAANAAASTATAPTPAAPTRTARPAAPPPRATNGNGDGEKHGGTGDGDDGNGGKGNSGGGGSGKGNSGGGGSGKGNSGKGGGHSGSNSGKG